MSASLVLGIVLAVLIIAFIVLLATGVLHFGKTPSPTPPVTKATCAEYALPQCQGARTTTGKVCRVDGAVCTELIPPGPNPPPPPDPANIATWFLANPHQQIRLRPKGSPVEYQLSYEGVTAPLQAINTPSVSVVAIRYTTETSTDQNANVRTVFDAFTGDMLLRSTATLAKASAPIPDVVDKVSIYGDRSLNTSVAHTAAPANYIALVEPGLKVTRYNSTGGAAGSLPPINFT